MAAKASHHKTHNSQTSHHTSKKSKNTIFLWGAIAAILLISIWYIARNYGVSDSTMTEITPTPQPTNATSQILSEEEKRQIDQWIQDNNLNEYGDPKDTVYAGGTPLFNELTGESIDVYDYILQQHPDRPWQQ